MTRTPCSSAECDYTRAPYLAGLIFVGLLASSPVFADTVPSDSQAAQAKARHLAELPPVAPPPGNRIVVDHSGRKEKGKASIYSRSFDGRRMADGRRYNPHTDVAASKSLPLGTVARVTNLQTGKSTEVRIEDRGPFIDGRVVDLTPHAAQAIGLTHRQGVAPVIVAPIAVPQPDGHIKPGAGAAQEEASSH